MQLSHSLITELLGRQILLQKPHQRYLRFLFRSLRSGLICNDCFESQVVVAFSELVIVRFLHTLR